MEEPRRNEIETRRHDDERGSGNPMEMLQAGSRIFSFLAGLGLIGTGFYFVVKLFGVMSHALTSPAVYAPILSQWAALLGKEQPMVVKTEYGQFDLSLVAAMAVVGGGLWLLTKLVVSVMVAGGRILAFGGSQAPQKK